MRRKTLDFRSSCFILLLTTVMLYELPLVSPLISSSINTSTDDDPCDTSALPDPLTLRGDQLTVLINGYSESRLPLLHRLASFYSTQSLVAAVLVLWGNPSTPSSALTSLSSISTIVSVIRDPSPSLNSRFLPRAAIRTRAVAICDDDVEPDPTSLALAFAVWRSNEHALAGFFARSHDLDLARKTWIYAVHHDRYSIVLTKFVILKTDYLHRYTCWGRLSEARALVERERNCEDILMNFVAAMEGGEGPVLVEGRRVRDWGDPRNSGNSSSSSSTEENEDGGRAEIRLVGLSSRGDHRDKRGSCIREFHRMLGVMPLRYSYGKVVGEVGEQGLCSKGGKLVLCNQQL